MKFPPRHIETKDVELLLAELWDFSRAWAGIHSQDSRGWDPHFGSGAERGWVRHLWRDEDLPCLRPPLSTEVKNESVVPSPLKQVPCRRETPESWSGKLVARQEGWGWVLEELCSSPGWTQNHSASCRAEGGCSEVRPPPPAAGAPTARDGGEACLRTGRGMGAGIS